MRPHKICMLCWNLVSSPKHRGSFYDNMAYAKGDPPLRGNLRTFLDKTEADVLQNTKK